MELYHHNQYIGELDNAWWEEARMEGFIPAKNAYRGDPNKAQGKEILEINLNDVKPVILRISSMIARNLEPQNPASLESSDGFLTIRQSNLWRSPWNHPVAITVTD